MFDAVGGETLHEDKDDEAACEEYEEGEEEGAHAFEDDAEMEDADAASAADDPPAAPAAADLPFEPLVPCSYADEDVPFAKFENLGASSDRLPYQGSRPRVTVFCGDTAQ